jgi:hypothetical protein
MFLLLSNSKTRLGREKRAKFYLAKKKKGGRKMPREHGSGEPKPIVQLAPSSPF